MTSAWGQLCGASLACALHFICLHPLQNLLPSTPLPPRHPVVSWTAVRAMQGHCHPAADPVGTQGPLPCCFMGLPSLATWVEVVEEPPHCPTADGDGTPTVGGSLGTLHWGQFLSMLTWLEAKRAKSPEATDPWKEKRAEGGWGVQPHGDREGAGVLPSLPIPVPRSSSIQL